jgi:hypothetical protein
VAIRGSKSFFIFGTAAKSRVEEKAKYESTSGPYNKPWYLKTPILNGILEQAGDIYMVVSAGDWNPIIGQVYSEGERFQACKGLLGDAVIAVITSGIGNGLMGSVGKSVRNLAVKSSSNTTTLLSSNKTTS